MASPSKPCPHNGPLCAVRTPQPWFRHRQETGAPAASAARSGLAAVMRLAAKGSQGIRHGRAAGRRPDGNTLVLGCRIATEHVQGICDEANRPLPSRENPAKVTLRLHAALFSAASGYGPRSTAMHASLLPARRYGQPRQSEYRRRLGGGTCGGVPSAMKVRTGPPKHQIRNRLGKPYLGCCNGFGGVNPAGLPTGLARKLPPNVTQVRIGDAQPTMPIHRGGNLRPCLGASRQEAKWTATSHIGATAEVRGKRS
jgi:hypothetical protein